MTDEERDELLIRLDERTKKIKDDLEDDYRALYGNGQPGLLDRVKMLEDWRLACQHHYGAVAVVIAFVVNAAIALYAAMK